MSPLLGGEGEWKESKSPACGVAFDPSGGAEWREMETPPWIKGVLSPACLPACHQLKCCQTSGSPVPALSQPEKAVPGFSWRLAPQQSPQALGAWIETQPGSEAERLHLLKKPGSGPYLNFFLSASSTQLKAS